MSDSFHSLEFIALQIDDLALQLRSLGIEDIAKQLDAARNGLEALCASGDVSAALVADQVLAS